MGSTPQTIQSLLHAAEPDLARLIGRARFLARVRAALVETLPDRAAARIHVAGYDDYCLTLHVAEAAWATRLRYMEADLCRALARRMRLQIDRVQIRVRPVVAAGPEPGEPRSRVLSAETRQLLERSAAHIDAPDLAAALYRLAGAGGDE
jgi:hypothetical protein